MMEHDKRLLIVDDSEIDREILKNVLYNEFDIIEADSGYAALEIIAKEGESLDAMILDVSMPTLDGFGLLKIMKENNVRSFPVFLITAEATKDNVEKAAQFNVSEFIKKPFNRTEILKRLRVKLGVVSDHHLTKEDIKETHKYIFDLEAIYRQYLSNFGKDSGHYMRITDLMKILLKEYAAMEHKAELDEEHIEIISKAGFFCDIGHMLFPSKLPGLMKLEDEEKGVYQKHTVWGADMIRLNYSKHCRYFVQVCADICIHHHERYDGKGFPHKIIGSNNLGYTQTCRLVDRFDQLFFKYHEHDELQFNSVVNELGEDKGAVSPAIFSLLTKCKSKIIRYYHMADESKWNSLMGL